MCRGARLLQRAGVRCGVCGRRKAKVQRSVNDASTALGWLLAGGAASLRGRATEPGHTWLHPQRSTSMETVALRFLPGAEASCVSQDVRRLVLVNASARHAMTFYGWLYCWSRSMRGHAHLSFQQCQLHLLAIRRPQGASKQALVLPSRCPQRWLSPQTRSSTGVTFKFGFCTICVYSSYMFHLLS